MKNIYLSTSWPKCCFHHLEMLSIRRIYTSVRVLKKCFNEEYLPLCKFTKMLFSTLKFSYPKNILRIIYRPIKFLVVVHKNGRSSETKIATFKESTYSENSCQQWKNGTLIWRIHQEMAKLWAFKDVQCFQKIFNASKDAVSSYIFYTIAQLHLRVFKFFQWRIFTSVRVDQNGVFYAYNVF